MAKRTFLAGVTSQTVDVFLQDSSSTIGAGLSGLLFNTANLKAYYRKGATGTLTAITLVTQTVGGAWSSGGFVEIDATNAKGFYRFDIPDTILASTPAAVIHFYGATNLAQNFSELEIVSYNPFDAVRLGLTALPNVASGSAGAIPTTGSGANQIAVNGSGKISGVVLVDTITAYTGNTPQTADVAALITTVGAAGAGLTSVGLSLAARQAIATTALIESYAGLHVAPTWAQILFEIRGLVAEKSVAGTTLTVNKLDGVTPAETFTLNDAAVPTAITRAS